MSSAKMSIQVARIKIDGKQHEISKLKFDQSNWKIHLDDWETVFESCPNLRTALTGKGEFFVKKEMPQEEKEILESDLARTWTAEARRVHKQTYDQEWRSHILNQIPALDTVIKVWEYIEKKCTAYQYADREYLEGSWNKLTSQVKNVKYPAKKITQGDKAAYIGEKINEIRSQLATLDVQKSNAEAVRLLIACMKECKWTELDFLWKQEEVKRDDDMDFQEFISNIKRVYGSKGEILELKEETPKSAFNAQEDSRPDSRPDKCGNCGYLHPNKACKFKDALCNKCNKKGHIARVCRSKKNWKKDGAGTGNFAYSAFMLNPAKILLGVTWNNVTKMAKGEMAFAPKVDQEFLKNSFGLCVEIGTLIDLEIVGHPFISGPTLYVVTRLHDVQVNYAQQAMTEDEFLQFLQMEEEFKTIQLKEDERLPPAWQGVKRSRSPNERRDESPPSYNTESDDDLKNNENALVAFTSFDGKKRMAVIDSGAGAVYIKDKELLTHMEEFQSSVKTAKVGEESQITHTGNLHLSIGKKRLIVRALYCPTFHVNLIGVCSLQDMGVATNFPKKEKFLELRYQGEIIKVPRSETGLYTIPLGTCPEKLEALAATSKLDILKLHECLGHPGRDVMLMELKTRNSEFKTTEVQKMLKDCEVCTSSKTTRRVLKNVKPRKQVYKPGELFHIDEVGPFSVTSISGHTWFSLGVDEFSGIVFGNFGTQRNLTVSLLKVIKAACDKMNYKLLGVRSDGAKAIQSEAQEMGIFHHSSLPRTPQENGCAERHIRTICQIARSLIIQAGFPRVLWEEAIKHAIYLHNRRFNVTRRGVPFELFFREKSEPRMLKFGQRIWISKIAQYDSGHKLDPKILKGYYTGESSSQDMRFSIGTSRSVRCFDGRRVITRDLVKSEELLYKHIETCEEAILLGVDIEELEGETDNEDSEDDDQFGNTEDVPRQQEPSEPILDDEQVQEIQSEISANEPDEATSDGEQQPVNIRRSERLQEKQEKQKSGPKGNSRAFTAANAGMSDQERSLLAFLSLEGRKKDPKHESEAGPEWRAAELKEVKNLDEYQVFGKIQRIKNLKDSQVLPFRIVYKTKFSATGDFEKMKVRYALRGDQDKLKDEVEKYAACVDLGVTLLVIGLSAFLGWKRVFADVESAFLLPDLNRIIWARMTKAMKFSTRI